ELTEHKAVSQKASLQFITEDISFHHGPLWAFKYHFVNSTRTVLAKGFLSGKLYLSDELTEHIAVSQKPSFQFLTEDISFFTIAL
ncbi:nef attachable domain protein, partial [Chlamydia psittaci C1/97]